MTAMEITLDIFVASTYTTNAFSKLKHHLVQAVTVLVQNLGINMATFPELSPSQLPTDVPMGLTLVVINDIPAMNGSLLSITVPISLSLPVTFSFPFFVSTPRRT
jgi:hypothetical protein